MFKIDSVTVTIKNVTYLIIPVDGNFTAQRLNDLASALDKPEVPKEKTWNAKTVGRRTTVKLAPYGLRKDGSPAKKRGRPAK